MSFPYFHHHEMLQPCTIIYLPKLPVQLYSCTVPLVPLQPLISLEMVVPGGFFSKLIKKNDEVATPHPIGTLTVK